MARVFLSGGFYVGSSLPFRFKANVGSSRLRISFSDCPNEGPSRPLEGPLISSATPVTPHPLPEHQQETRHVISSLYNYDRASSMGSSLHSRAHRRLISLSSEDA